MSSIPLWGGPVLVAAGVAVGWWGNHRYERRRRVETAQARRQQRFDVARAWAQTRTTDAFARAQVEMPAARRAITSRTIEGDAIAGSDLPPRDGGLTTTIRMPAGPARYPWPHTSQQSGAVQRPRMTIWGRIVSVTRRVVGWWRHRSPAAAAAAGHAFGTVAGVLVRVSVRITTWTVTAAGRLRVATATRSATVAQTWAEWREAAGPATGETWPEGLLRNLQQGAHHHRPGARSLRLILGHRVPPRTPGRHRPGRAPGCVGQRTAVTL